MNLTALLPLLKLFEESRVVSPKFERPAFRPTKPPREKITPPSTEAGLRPDCGIGKKAVLINGEWVCIAQFD